MAVVGGTAISNIMQLGSVHHVNLVGDIPMGLPLPELPPVKLLWMVAVDSIAIAIVSYTVTISMAMILAKKHDYEVRPNQELLAMVNFARNFISSHNVILIIIFRCRAYQILLVVRFLVYRTQHHCHDPLSKSKLEAELRLHQSSHRFLFLSYFCGLRRFSKFYLE